MLHYGSVRTSNRINRTTTNRRDSGSGSLLSKRSALKLLPLLQEAGVNLDQYRGRTLDISFADQSELEDLLERSKRDHHTATALTVSEPLSTSAAGPDDQQQHHHHHHNAQNNQFRRSSCNEKDDGGNTLQDLSEQKDDDEESIESDKSDSWKRQVKMAFTHVGLVLLTCTYTVIGASIFYAIEKPNEYRMKQMSMEKIFNEENDFLDEMYFLAKDQQLDRRIWRLMAHEKLMNLTDIVFTSFEKYYLTSKEIRENTTSEIWTFSASIFFAATVVTTIGYGNPVPITFAGRMVCVFFALFGIPLTLLTIANVGKFLSEHLLFLYGCYLRLMQRIRPVWLRLRGRTDECEPEKKSGPDGQLVCDKCRRPSTEAGHRRKSSLSDIDFMDIEEKTVPASVVLSILIGYTALGGFLFCNVETWDFFEAFYFSFITMTTIGFGDLIPHRSQMVLILLYIVLGLAITTMCVDLVGAHYVRKIHYFGRKIQDARSALAIVGGKVVYVGELYAQIMSKRYGVPRDQMTLIPDAFIIENLYLTKHLIPFIPKDIKRIRYIDDMSTESLGSSTCSFADNHSCRYCRGRMSVRSHYSQSKSPMSYRLQQNA